MTVIAVTASRTSPGATSLATGLALALSAEYDRALLVEADSAGGVLSLRFDLEATPSLATFENEARAGYSPNLVWKNTQDLRGARCMAAPIAPHLARTCVERATPTLIEHLPTLGAPVIIDLGWLGEDGPSLPLAAAADMTLIVTRPEIAEVQALLFQVRQLQGVEASVGLVTIGTDPQDPQQIAALAGVPLVAVLPDDAAVAAALRGATFAPKKFRRSSLWRTIGEMATNLVDAGVLMARSASDAVPVEMADDTAGHAFPTSYAELAPDMLALPADDTPTTAVEYQLVDETNRLVSVEPAELVLETGERHELNFWAATLVGRHADCDVVLVDSQVSRNHGRLTRTAAGWHFADLDSSNGSLLNGAPCQTALLSPGDELRIGNTRLVFYPVTNTAELKADL